MPNEANIATATDYLYSAIRRGGPYLPIDDILIVATYRGFVQASLQVSRETGHDDIWTLHDLFVTADHRHRGVATMLIRSAIDFLEADARPNKPERMQGLAHVENWQARAAFERNGFVEVDDGEMVWETFERPIHPQGLQVAPRFEDDDPRKGA